jgi:hypothetical protein
MFKKIYQYYKLGKLISKDYAHVNGKKISLEERSKFGKRTNIINHLLQLNKAENYLEIGIRNPSDNFDLIKCKNKYSVDPGLEIDFNPAIYPFESDVFFRKLFNNELDISSEIKFDVIFIDGLHLANQASRDILNSIKCLNDDGFIVMHDCNPPNEYFAREDYAYANGPSSSFWNGTTWKAFYNARHFNDIYSGCVDCDWGVGILSKNMLGGLLNRIDNIENQFYEFNIFESNRSRHLNLFSYDEFILGSKKWL